MLITYANTYAPLEQKTDLVEMAQYAFGFYVSHVVIIIAVSNLVFYLKEIDPRFKASEDEAFNDLPTLKDYNKRLEEEKARGGLSRGFLVDNLVTEYGHIKSEIETFAQAHPISNVIPLNGAINRMRTSSMARRGSMSSNPDQLHSNSNGGMHHMPSSHLHLSPLPTVEEEKKDSSITSPFFNSEV